MRLSASTGVVTALSAVLGATRPARAQATEPGGPAAPTTEAAAPTSGPAAETAPESPMGPVASATRDRPVVAPTDAQVAAQMGGPWTTPTLLVRPAGALPQWSVRALVGTEYQSAIRSADTFRPTGQVSMGLGYGLTAHVQVDWVGGAAETTNAFAPNVGVSYQLFGARNGQGLLGGVSARFKWVGFTGRAPEVELAYSMQYRSRVAEAGVEVGAGQAVNIEERDAEARAYATVHFGDVFSAGAAGLMYIDLSPGSIGYWNLRGGLIAAATLDRFQVGILLGASNFRLPNATSLSPFGQMFLAYRFN